MKKKNFFYRCGKSFQQTVASYWEAYGRQQL